MRLVLLMIAITSVEAIAAQAAELPTVVVAPIKQLSPFEGIAMLTEELRTQVARHGKYRLVTPEEMAAVDGELQRQLEGGCSDSSCVAEIGGALGARFVITGQIGKLGRIYSLNLKLIDIETVAAKQAASARATSVEDFLEKMPTVVDDLLGESLRRKMKVKAKSKGTSLLGSGIAKVNALTDKVQRQLKREREALRGDSSEPPAPTPASSPKGFRQVDVASQDRAKGAVTPVPLGAIATRKHTFSLAASTTNLVSLRYAYRTSPHLQLEVDFAYAGSIGLRFGLLGRLDRGASLHAMGKVGGVAGLGAYALATLTGGYHWVRPSGWTYGLHLGAGAAGGTFYGGPFAEICAQIGKSF